MNKPTERGDLEKSEESLWLYRSKHGDSDAFARLVEIYQRPVYSLCYRMLGNAEDAEDAAQESFLRAYKSMNRYDSNRPFSTWLLSIAAHYCIDQLRKQRYRIVSFEELPIPELPSNSIGHEEKISRKESQNRVRQLLNILKPTDRAIVILYYWYDYSYEEICKTLSLTPGAVKSRLHRARRAMSKKWLEHYPENLVVERVMT
jgi:RNA polymerase sigma-70 factor (ECF subfamily)